MQSQTSQVENWLVEALVSNHQQTYHVIPPFENAKEVMVFFCGNSEQKISDTLECLTKSGVITLSERLKQRQFELTEVGVDAFNHFNSKALTIEDATLLGTLVSFNTPELSVIKELLGKADFKYKDSPQNSHYYHLYRHRYNQENISNLVFVEVVLKNLPMNIIEKLMHCREESFFARFAEQIYTRAIELGIYVFQLVDVKHFESGHFSLQDVSDFSGTPDDVIMDVVELFDNDKLTPYQLLMIFEGPKGFYIDLINRHKLLSERKRLLACAALEQLSGRPHPRSRDLSGFMAGATFGFQKSVIPESVNNYIDCFRKEDRAAVWITALFSESAFKGLDPDTIRMGLKGVEALQLEDAEITTLSDIYQALKLIDHETTLSDVAGYGLSILLETITIPEHEPSSFICFGESDSDAWYNNYTETRYDVVSLTSKDYLSDELRSEIGQTFLSIMKRAIASNDPYVVAAQAPRLHRFSSGYFDLFEWEDVICEAFANLSPQDLDNLPADAKLSGLYFGIKKNAPWASSLIGNIDSVPFSGPYTDSVGAHNNGTGLVLTKDSVDRIHQCLMTDESSVLKTLFTLQTNVIGRVSRDINESKVLYGLCLEEARYNHLVQVHSTSYDVDLDAHKDLERPEYLKADMRKSRFAHTHFPRLKNRKAHKQIDLLHAYLEKIGLIKEMSDTDYIEGEGIVTIGNTRYVFGEFDWEALFDKKMRSNEINKLVFWIPDIENDTVDATEINFTEMTGQEFGLLYELRVISIANRLSLNASPTVNQLNLCAMHYLPRIEHEGIVVNDK